MNSRRPTAIVTDALWRKSVSAIRALGTAGFQVFALGDSLLTTGFYSRHSSRCFRGPAAVDDVAGFAETLRKAITEAGDAPVAILPMEDASCEWLVANGGTLPSNARWLLPSQSVFAIARDKGLTLEHARSIGIPIPESFAPDSVNALRELVAAHDTREFILKPRTGTGSGGIVYGEQILTTPLDRHWEQHGALLFQQRIPPTGEALGVSLLFDREGTERAAFAHKRLRQYPVTGGPSTQRQAIALDELHDMSSRLLKSLAWRGVAMVEWKVHPRTGAAMLLEINPRFWGSLALAVRSGVDFPTLYAQAAIGQPLPAKAPAYRTGTICRWLVPGDILRYCSEPADSRESLSRFLKGVFRDAEEFDRHDLRGSLACVICPGLLAANPKYWRYLRRNRKNRT